MGHTYTTCDLNADNNGTQGMGHRERYKLRQRQQGRCITCGGALCEKSVQYCKKHYEIARAGNQRRYWAKKKCR